MTKSILVNLQEGVSPENLLPANDSAPSEGYFIERVHSLGGMNDGVASESLSFADEQPAYDQLNEEDKKIYRTYKIVVPDNVDANQFLREVRRMKGVNYAQINEMNVLTMSQNDPLISQMYALKRIQAADAWVHSSGKDVVVAVVDTGVDYKHPDISVNMWQDDAGHFGYNFSDGNFDPMDDHSHGTHVAGIIAATGNNAVGISGVAFGAKIMALKVFPNAQDDVCAKAIKYAADNGARIINNSWLTNVERPSNPTLEEAIDYAVRRNVLVIFGAGNNGRNVARYSPANYPPVLCVAETDEDDLVTLMSNFGKNVALAAPGSKILSLDFRTDDYFKKSGTSMAAAHVSGVAALIIGKRPNLTVAEIREKLVKSADVIKASKPIGAGRVNAFKAVQ